MLAEVLKDLAGTLRELGLGLEELCPQAQEHFFIACVRTVQPPEPCALAPHSSADHDVLMAVSKDRSTLVEPLLQVRLKEHALPSLGSRREEVSARGLG